MALPPHRKVMFGDDSDRPRKESKAREYDSSDDTNETGSSGTGSTGSTNQLQCIEGWLCARENFHVVSDGFPRQLPLISVLSCNQALTDYHENHVKPRIPTMLRTHNVAYRFFGLDTRRNPGIVDPA